MCETNIFDHIIVFEHMGIMHAWLCFGMSQFQKDNNGHVEPYSIRVYSIKSHGTKRTEEGREREIVWGLTEGGVVDGMERSTL